MIKITRAPTPPPIRVFTNPSVCLPDGTHITRADHERSKAIAFFTDPNHFKDGMRLSKQKFGFSIYKDAELVRALEAALGRKCVYCESRFAHVTPKEIEHFRPRLQIERRGQPPLIPGYFWLAGDWWNLLIACTDCNRARDHEIPGQTQRVRLGKQAQFPLRTEELRVRCHTGSLDTEEPARLLLHPCIDDPEKHLTFDDQGLVYAAEDATGARSDMATISIDVYALQRKALVEERLRVLNTLKVIIDELRDVVIEFNALQRATEPNETALDFKRNQIRRLHEHLQTFTHQDAPYLAMIRGYIRRKKGEGAFTDLEAAGIDLENLLA